ncbi:MAG: endonuclease III [Candidatus Marinimicrobia bacterium]|nr:endonuclease III [Candidatus Neomarinimicrobiota bacterium]
MPRESRARKAGRAAEINGWLAREYPDAACALVHNDAYQLLVATILSAQCTDKRVNLVTPAFFAAYPDARALAEAPSEDVVEAIHSTGFYNHKAKSLQGMARQVVEQHGGQIPDTMEALTRLPGVGRKTANVVLGNVFGIPGLTVDTHMIRLNNLLGLVQGKDAVKIERTLMTLLPPEEWTMYSHRIIEHGRTVCIARRPRCPDCVLNELCPSALEPVKSAS